MKPQHVFLFIVLTGFLLSCGKIGDTRHYSLDGKAQKGPFVTGTDVTLYELDGKLNQTGAAFTTSITDDDGRFRLEDVAMESHLALLKANGYFFSEIYGELSGSTLSLRAIADLDRDETVNINVFTHLIGDRIKYLVNEGMDFREAEAQAESEFLNFLGVTDRYDEDFDNLDFTMDEAYSEALLAFSVILQRTTFLRSERNAIEAELTGLMNRLSNDFAPDGQVNDQALIDTLLHNVSMAHLVDIRDHVETHYSGPDPSIAIPDFESAIENFQEKYSEKLFTQFTYPAEASPDLGDPESPEIPNLLLPHDTVFEAWRAYSIAAIVPLGSSLTIKFIGDNSNYNYVFGGRLYGWKLEHIEGGYAFSSQHSNALMSALFNLETPGHATIEYYENNAEEPTYTKKISWESSVPVDE